MPSKLLLPLFALFLLISAGCGGSDSGSKLEVTQLNPSNNSDEVSRDATISVHFNKPISPNLLDEFSLSVFSPEEKIEGKVSVGDDGKSLVFSPSDLLQYSTEFEVELSGKMNANWAFKTLRNDTFITIAPAFSVADIGDDDLFIIYLSPVDETNLMTWKSRIYLKDTLSWSEELTHPTGSFASRSFIASPAGNIIVFEPNENDSSLLSYKLYSPDTQSWTQGTLPDDISTFPHAGGFDQPDASSIQILEDGQSSDALKSVNLDDNTTTEIPFDFLTRHYNPRSFLKFNGNGDGVMVWKDLISPNEAYFKARRYDASTSSWSQAESIATLNGLGGFLFPIPRVFIHDSGDIIVLWESVKENEQEKLFARQYDAESDTWQAEQVVAAGAGLNVIDITTSDNQHIALLYYLESSHSTKVIYAQFYDPDAKSWSSEKTVIKSNECCESIFGGSISINQHGNAVVSWQKFSNSISGIKAKQYNASEDLWSPSQTLDESRFNAYSPKAFLDDEGDATVIWHQYFGDRYRIDSNQYDADSKAWSGVHTLYTSKSVDEIWNTP